MNEIKLAVSAEIVFHDLIQRLINLSYQRVSIVVDQGDMAVRGGIVDVYPSNRTHPMAISSSAKDQTSLYFSTLIGT